MKKIAAISLLLLLSVLLFVSPAETKRGHAAPASADLSVTKEDSPDPVNAGSNLTYTITVSNNGPDAAANASWSDTLPPGTTFVSMPDVSGWSCTTPAAGDSGTVSCSNPSFAVRRSVFTLTVRVAPTVAARANRANTGTNTVTWNGVVPANDSVTIVIDATIKTGTEGHTIANQGSISYDADGNGTNEASASTNIDSFVVGAAPLNADLGVTKTAPDTAPADSDVTHTITVFNGGPDTATSATLTDTLQGNMTFVSLSQPAGWSCNSLTPGLGGTLTCSRDLPAGSGPQVFTLVGHIPSGTADGTLYNNMATVSTTATDPTAENNTSTAGTIVSCATNPIVTTSADSGPGSLRRAIQDACDGATITFDMTQVVSPI